MKQDERPLLGKMPVVEVAEPVQADKFVALLNSLVRRQAVKLLSGQASEFNAELLKFLEKVQTDAYNRGIKAGLKINEL